jgi:hypothetical protein
LYCVNDSLNTQTNENIKRLFQTTTIQMKCGEKRMNTDDDDEVSTKWWSEMWLIRRREHQQQSEWSK